MGKQLLLFCFAVFFACAITAEEAVPSTVPQGAAGTEKTLPLNWQQVNAQMSIDSNKVIIVKAEKHLGGIQCKLKPPKDRRIRVIAEVKGMGKTTVAFNGSFGWSYHNMTLSDQWQNVSIEYGEPSGDLMLAVLSMNNGPADMEIKNIKAFPLDISEYLDEEIPPVGFKALDYPGPNGRVTAAGMYGKRWYHIVKMPVPTNTRPIFYFVHIKSEDGAIKDLYWMGKGQRTNAENSISAEKANGQWAWVKTGPYKAILLPEEITLGFSGDPKIGAIVDKIVISTNDELTDQQLDAVELQ